MTSWWSPSNRSAASAWAGSKGTKSDWASGAICNVGERLMGESSAAVNPAQVQVNSRVPRSSRGCNSHLCHVNTTNGLSSGPLGWAPSTSEPYDESLPYLAPWAHHLRLVQAHSLHETVARKSSRQRWMGEAHPPEVLNLAAVVVRLGGDLVDTQVRAQVLILLRQAQTHQHLDHPVDSQTAAEGDGHATQGPDDLSA